MTYRSKIEFTVDPDIKMWEKEVVPPEHLPMYNMRWHPIVLPKVAEVEVEMTWDPKEFARYIM